MQLYIGNKNYSSWSMRPWVLMREFQIPFEEVMLRFDGFSANSRFKQAAMAIAPTGRVPVLVDEGFAVWDTLAIAEYLADLRPDLALWPRERLARARARCLCAEMHSGFGALRSACPMNIEAHLPEVGQRVLTEQPAVAADLARLESMWSKARSEEHTSELQSPEA
jgi:glutathione S-transferase